MQLKMAIVHARRPDIIVNQEQANLVQQNILEQVNTIPAEMTSLVH